MGLLASAVIEHACGGDATRLKRLRVRFARQVLPGDHIRIRAYRGEASMLTLDVRNQRDEAVLTHASAELR